MGANFIDISFVAPCFNEEAALHRFYEEITRIASALNENGQASTCELIFVDDGSVDATASILRDFALRDERVRYLIFSRNFGKEAALLAGLRKARGRYVVTLDADLQDPPSLIPEMLAAVASGEFDCAGTRRITRKGEPAIRSFFARRFYQIMAKLTDIEVVDGARDFRLMSRSYVNAVLSLNERIRFSKGIFPWVGFRSKWFEYENIRRATGETKWSFGKLFLYSLDGIFAFSSKPLAIASILGILFFLLSLAFIAMIIFRRIIWGDPVDGWASTACIILFCSGVQLFTTGILGQYLAKVYEEIKQRPHYIVREEK
ncbi:MAG: glycosyltransferase [Prevotellaceae bacterium]|jgi:glycosyltransferase involved in cell wall biosynthesis|nr:glycosyltransferase [Prevotellaceae bacterium]